MRKRLTWVLIVFVALPLGAGCVAVLLARRGGARVPGAGPRAGGSDAGRDGASLGAARARAPVPAAPPSRTGVLEVEALERALAGSDATGARTAARDLRLRLRTDAQARARAEEMLLAAETASDLRAALALVLGTLPGDAGDAALLRAVEQFPADTALVRASLLALGAQREPEDDDDVFGLGDRPHGVTGPGGLGITVRRVVPAGEVQRTLSEHLHHAAAEVRWAAARALAESVAGDFVRAAFLRTLAVERSDDVAAALGKPLAVWAGGQAEDGERGVVAGALLARAGEPDLDAFRFTLEETFDRLPLSAGQRADLADLARPERPFGIRAFALTALARGAAHGGEGALGDARRSLETALGDAEVPVRDLAARWLGRLPYDVGSASRLAAVGRGDRAWNVRFTALEAVAATAPKEEALAALRAALDDPDPRVAGRASELVRSVSARR